MLVFPIFLLMITVCICCTIINKNVSKNLFLGIGIADEHTFPSTSLFNFYFLEIIFSRNHFPLVGDPAGGSPAVRGLPAAEPAVATETSTRGSSAPASLLGLTEDPTRCCVGYSCLPGPGDYRLQSGTAQKVSSGVGGRLSHQLDQAGRDVPVRRVCEVNWVIL